jgi:hypothetical protein
VDSASETRGFPEPLDLARVRVYPLNERRSLSALKDMLANPPNSQELAEPVHPERLVQCAERMRQARSTGAGVVLMYGAHLVKNGLMDVVNRLIEGGWITHLATNGAGVIHDWELAHLGRTEESVRANVAAGCFGTWDETGRAIHLAVLTGALRGEGFGRSLGRFIDEDGVTLPSKSSLERELMSAPGEKLAPARAELLAMMQTHGLEAGRHAFDHPHRKTSIVWQAWRSRIPLTVHPGIGYDIFSAHPWFNGAAIGRAAGLDFAMFARGVDTLDNGVLLSVGSAIMAPQVFEKSLSVVNNLRLQSGRPIVLGHSIYVVDIQDAGNWDWNQGEPPRDNPAYYLRFCKTYARMGGEMAYLQCDNRWFLHGLLDQLSTSPRQ